MYDETLSTETLFPHCQRSIGALGGVKKYHAAAAAGVPGFIGGDSGSGFKLINTSSQTFLYYLPLHFCPSPVLLSPSLKSEPAIG